MMTSILGLRKLQRAVLYASLGNPPPASIVTNLPITGTGKTKMMLGLLKVRKRRGGRRV